LKILLTAYPLTEYSSTVSTSNINTTEKENQCDGLAALNKNLDFADLDITHKLNLGVPKTYGMAGKCIYFLKACMHACMHIKFGFN